MTARQNISSDSKALEHPDYVYSKDEGIQVECHAVGEVCVAQLITEFDVKAEDVINRDFHSAQKLDNERVIDTQA